MRLLAVSAIVLGVGAAGSAAGQTFSPLPATIRDELALAPQLYIPPPEPISQTLRRQAFIPGQGPVAWGAGEVIAPSRDGTVVNSMRVSRGGVLNASSDMPLRLTGAAYDPKAYEIAFSRTWPGAVRSGGEGFGFDVSPHAGLGAGSDGGSIEAGAMLRFGKGLGSSTEDRLNAMGVQSGRSFGDKGRWYLFAAVSDRAVGFNMAPGPNGVVPSGWSTDSSTKMLADAQVGIGYRKGPMQTSFGFVRRDIDDSRFLQGRRLKKENMVGLSFTLRPNF